ncbi:imidazolonepropionase [Aureispira sp. CCB-E]|uniref:imidazolonepropionase n=1 Tax=Aureispira sp. CCB-E TaxID=3051121 RepID=UPI0028683EBE|nr:imidazolonepropionase [Aureispira sp. CCB-E]WMX15173.1 imidazolonepropionase [Aureispira sp. CCB-E]
MHTLIRNIKTLLLANNQAPKLVQGADMKTLPQLNNAFVLVEEEQIVDWGSMDNCPTFSPDQTIDATGAFVLPTWCDSHTHLVFAATREGEFIDKIQGVSYEEIARKGGGILNSAQRLQTTPHEVLLESAYQRLMEVKNYGTGAIEIKSGYGLTVDAELKMLRVIRDLKSKTKMPIKATFLGAHALPLAYKENRAGYLDLIVHKMLPQIADEGLADYIDVFCEKVAFSVAETEQIMEAGAKYGLKPKIHTNQFNCMGGIQASIAHKAISVDHLEVINDEEIACLLASDTMATLLPSAPFFINDHYPQARKMIDAGMAVALASDYNPGSTPSGKIPFVLSLACIKMKMLPEEAIHAATLNGAYAMEESHRLGTISKGKLANLIITKPMNSIAYMPYAFGSDWIDKVMIAGSL